MSAEAARAMAAAGTGTERKNVTKRNGCRISGDLAAVFRCVKKELYTDYRWGSSFLFKSAADTFCFDFFVLN